MIFAKHWLIEESDKIEGLVIPAPPGGDSGLGDTVSRIYAVETADGHRWTQIVWAENENLRLPEVTVGDRALRPQTDWSAFSHPC